jgi:hypothetical protein
MFTGRRLLRSQLVPTLAAAVIPTAAGRPAPAPSGS